MNCARFETLLSDYMDGALDGRVRSAMDQHRQECSACSSLLREVASLRRELAHFPEVPVREELIERVLLQTTGKPEKLSFWQGLVLPAIQPFLTQRYAFATLMIFVFISFAANVMGPGFSVSSYSRFSPAALMARADEFSGEIYKTWREFNDLKSRAREELRLFKEDLIGRLDYHLVGILFESYEDSLQQQQEEKPVDAPPGTEPSKGPAKADGADEREAIEGNQR